MGPLEWRREPKQDAEAFARSVCNSILKFRAKPPLPGRLNERLLDDPNRPKNPGAKGTRIGPNHDAAFGRVDA